MDDSERSDDRSVVQEWLGIEDESEINAEWRKRQIDDVLKLAVPSDLIRR